MVGEFGNAFINAYFGLNSVFLSIDIHGSMPDFPQSDQYFLPGVRSHPIFEDLFSPSFLRSLGVDLSGGYESFFELLIG